VKVVGGVARDIARNFIQRWNKSKKQKLPFIALKSLPDPKNNEKYPACTVQCLRSASYWSVGLKTVEASIYKAQLDAINNAKYFIYIENQFFVSATSDSQSNPQNKIAQALVNK
jgi:phospholipase D1/2